MDLTWDEQAVILRAALGPGFTRRIECQFRHRASGAMKPALDLRTDRFEEWRSIRRIVVETPWRPEDLTVGEQ